MSTEGFHIEEIGSEIAPTAGLPDGCDLCGHCRMLGLFKRKQGQAIALPCGRSPESVPSKEQSIAPLIRLTKRATGS